MDCISSLPDDILHRILSFLSIKEAALTSPLSKRWRNLFVSTPNLCFEEKDFAYQTSDLNIPRSFRDFLDRVLVMSSNYPLKRFSLSCRHNVDAAHPSRWIRSVMSRGVLEVLHLDIYIFDECVTSLPLEVFTCKTLVKLNLGKRYDIAMVPESVSLPSLKTLVLDRVRFYNHAFEVILTACLVLEELTIVGKRWQHWAWCRIVSCPTLKRLTINCEVSDKSEGFTASDYRSISFDTPNLVYLEYSGFIPDEYPVVNLESLVEAKLTLALRKRSYKSNPTNLINGLRNVEILNLLSLETAKVFCSSFEAFPLFENMSCLSIETASSSRPCRILLSLLLEKTPTLETLIIKGSLFGYFFELPYPVKVLEITKYTLKES